jgi:hypothetical protein
MGNLNGEQIITLVGLVMTALSGGVGFLAKRWADGRILVETAELKANADRDKALADAWLRMVTKAEEREDAAIGRIKATTETMNELSLAVRQFADIGRVTTEEVKRNGERMERLLRRQESIERVLGGLSGQRYRLPSDAEPDRGP